MKKYVTIEKGKGVFYSVYGDDAYVMSSITRNKIKGDRLCFTVKSIEIIKTLLEKNKINYRIKEKYNIIEEKTFNRNGYNKHFKIGKEKYNENIDKKILIDQIKKLDHEKIESISKYINYVIYK